MTLSSLPIESILFYLFSGVLIVSAFMVVSSTNPIRSALFLVLGFFASAALWLILQAEFLALVLVLVYVGAVMTLFLFVIMTLNIDIGKTRLNKYLPLGLLITAILVGITILVLTKTNFAGLNPVNYSSSYSNTQALGSVLYTDYVYPFEIAGIILLVAIIAAIALSFREERNRKVQKIEAQIAVKREDRIRLISMPAEKKAGTLDSTPET